MLWPREPDFNSKKKKKKTKEKEEKEHLFWIQVEKRSENDVVRVVGEKQEKR